MIATAQCLEQWFMLHSLNRSDYAAPGLILDRDGGGYAKIGRSVNEETGSKKFFAPSTVLRVDDRQVSCYP